MSSTKQPAVVRHPDENASNALRERLVAIEPRGQRTFTPSLAVFARSAGSYHWTPEGRKLADFTSGVLVANLGHNPARWWQRVWDYMKVQPGLASGNEAGQGTSEFLSAAPLTAYNGLTELEVMASERLVEFLRGEPGGNRMQHVLWAASGSEAIQKALWSALARRPGQDIMLATRIGFHGKKGLAGAVTGSEHDRERDPRVRFLSFPTTQCDTIERRRQSLDLAPYRAELQALWDEHGANICCLITEPYLGGGGSFHPQPEYLQLLQSFCREHDILFILDEIQANFGRTGPLFAYSHYGLEPDVVCLGKGLANGIPVAAAVGRADVFAALQYGEGSDTWSANPLSSAAVLATLDEFADGRIIEQGRELAGVLEAGLVSLTETAAVAKVRGEGTVWGIECSPVGSLSANEVACEIVRRCYLGDEQGRAVHLLGPLAGKVLRVSPPLVMPLEEAREYLGVMRSIVGQMCDELAASADARSPELVEQR